MTTEHTLDMESLGSYRPQRQRKSVCHYSDDNPNTFTVKVKKSERLENASDSGAELPTSEEKKSASRKGVKRPRPSDTRTKTPIDNEHRQQQQQQQGDDSDDDDNVIIASLVQQGTAVPATTPARP